jgi:drug/metabolite transporter (DMT)-like permease
MRDLSVVGLMVKMTQSNPDFRKFSLRRLVLSPYFSAAIAMLCWALSFVVIRGTHEMVPPIGLNFWRSFLALLLLIAMGFSHLRLEMRVILNQWKTFFLLGFLLVLIGNTAMFVGLQFTTAINAGLLNSMGPVVIVVSSWLLFRETVTPLQMLGILTSLAGVIILITRADITVLTAFDFNRGDLWILVAVIGWALYAVLVRRTAPTMHSLAFMTAVTFCGIVLLFPLYLWESLTQRPTELNAPTVLSIIYLGLFTAVFAILLWTRAIRMLGANNVGLFIHLVPVFSVILAIIFLGEVLRGFHLIGIALIAIGLYLTTVIGSKG